MSDVQAAIRHRRDGGPNSEAELWAVAQGAADGSIPDYQLAAWLMAAYLNPLGPAETAALTQAMAHSGERLDLTGLPRPWLDKHSTGGVGDKTTIVLLPLLAACGLTVVKMSGRGLGHTGGTVDKLASVPGFRLDLTPEAMKAQAARIGLALTGQTPRLAPADKALYALRDATETVGSLPLIVSSILSKKIAGGAETVVLDVKCGSGALMPDFPRAETLALALHEVGTHAGLRVRCAITDMTQPLGHAVGNALEVKEALRVTDGREGGRFAALCRDLAVLALTAAGQEDAPARVEAAIKDGAAGAKAREWFAAQGADLAVFDSDDWATAPVQETVVWDGAPGWAREVDALAVGRAAVGLGAGRSTKEDEIDPRVGIVMAVEVGQRVEPGQTLATVHAADGGAADRAAAEVRSAVKASDVPVPATAVVLKVI